MSVCLVFVRRRTVFVRTAFFEDLLILTVTGFSDLHSALRKSTHAISSVTSYLVGRGSLLPLQEHHPTLGPSGIYPVFPTFHVSPTPPPPHFSVPMPHSILVTEFIFWDALILSCFFRIFESGLCNERFTVCIYL